MWKFFGRLFGSDKATETLIDNVSNGIDKIWYTEEEKAADKMQARREGQAVMMEWMRNSQGQNIARRLLALCITFAWLSMFLISVLLNVTAIWSTPEQATLIQQSAAIIKSAAEDITSAVMLILGFYFAAPYMGKMAEGALARFGQRNDGTIQKS